jgi:hypothetical protein
MATITKESLSTMQGMVKGRIGGGTVMNIKETFRKTNGKVGKSSCLCEKLCLLRINAENSTTIRKRHI